MNQQRKKITDRKRRHQRVRAKIKGTADWPRVAVFRSVQHIYSQVIDDNKKRTILSLNDLKVKEKNKTARAFKTGELLGGLMKKAKLSQAVFDRGGFQYHGRVKALAEGLRKSGIKL